MAFPMRASLVGMAVTTMFSLAAPAMAQAVDGGAIFRQRCQMCHVSMSGQRAGLGPNLARVVGRKAASTDFLYSPALKASGLTWDKGTLDRFLTAPAKLVPGTRMAISVPKDPERRALVDYLGTLRK